MIDTHRPQGRPDIALISDLEDALLGMEALLFALHELADEPSADGKRLLTVRVLLGFMHAEHARADKALELLAKGEG